MSHARQGARVAARSLAPGGATSSTAHSMPWRQGGGRRGGGGGRGYEAATRPNLSATAAGPHARGVHMCATPAVGAVVGSTAARQHGAARAHGFCFFGRPTCNRLADIIECNKPRARRGPQGAGQETGAAQGRRLALLSLAVATASNVESWQLRRQGCKACCRLHAAQHARSGAFGAAPPGGTTRCSTISYRPPIVPRTRRNRAAQGVRSVRSRSAAQIAAAPPPGHPPAHSARAGRARCTSRAADAGRPALAACGSRGRRPGMARAGLASAGALGHGGPGAAGAAGAACRCGVARWHAVDGPHFRRVRPACTPAPASHR